MFCIGVFVQSNVIDIKTERQDLNLAFHTPNLTMNLTYLCYGDVNLICQTMVVEIKQM
ncbi:hypothetical protein SAMN04487906_1535 [Zhouia amylolytica]|uniref:Uncharacterized protein n=1 Tax=Zhouia amylolytica TaxID=376730 RepID=A0A1I6SCV0_9FLAO|nr:hypothetical protein SAMN04487906_1535 [Zhouia amylolytica]